MNEDSVWNLLRQGSITLEQALDLLQEFYISGGSTEDEAIAKAQAFIETLGADAPTTPPYTQYPDTPLPYTPRSLYEQYAGTSPPFTEGLPGTSPPSFAATTGTPTYLDESVTGDVGGPWATDETMGWGDKTPEEQLKQIQSEYAALSENIEGRRDLYSQFLAADPGYLTQHPRTGAYLQRQFDPLSAQHTLQSLRTGRDPIQDQYDTETFMDYLKGGPTRATRSDFERMLQGIAGQFNPPTPGMEDLYGSAASARAKLQQGAVPKNIIMQSLLAGWNPSIASAMKPLLEKKLYQWGVLNPRGNIMAHFLGGGFGGGFNFSPSQAQPAQSSWRGN